MWPFKKKKAEISWQTKAIADLAAFRSVGSRFNYCGVDMVVAAHYSYGTFTPRAGHILIPGLRAHYQDKNGKLRQVTFGYNELPAVILESQRK